MSFAGQRLELPSSASQQGAVEEAMLFPHCTALSYQGALSLWHGVQCNGMSRGRGACS